MDKQNSKFRWVVFASVMFTYLLSFYLLAAGGGLLNCYRTLSFWLSPISTFNSPEAK
ncbi:hypothetical protein [Neobacillus soli]|uniref:hypothetical protein n=1 Tax=Neobacillus soli TaxID=220688 RepID=UPI000B01CE56|nr:hypothetical protein [Neobacillus soli]